MSFPPYFYLPVDCTIDSDSRYEDSVTSIDPVAFANVEPEGLAGPFHNLDEARGCIRILEREVKGKNVVFKNPGLDSYTLFVIL